MIVDERSASGGEWAGRILRDAGRAAVIGGRTVGAEAAVQRSTGPDGSVVAFSAWPMAEPGVTPFQETGIQLDHAIPLTVKVGKALQTLNAPAELLDALVAMADAADRPDETPKKK